MINKLKKCNLEEIIATFFVTFYRYENGDIGNNTPKQKKPISQRLISFSLVYF